MQMMVLSVSLVLMAVVALIFVAAVRSAGIEQAPANTDRNRTFLIYGMLIVGVVVTAGSLRQWPHAISSSTETVQVNATGYQWYWELDKEEVPVGKSVIFNVHTKDATHGLGVIDPNGRLLFQTQAMPGYVNQVEYIFSEPGKHQILCMEFCGIGHHDMTSEFNVVAK